MEEKEEKYTGPDYRFEKLTPLTDEEQEIFWREIGCELNEQMENYEALCKKHKNQEIDDLFNSELGQLAMHYGIITALKPFLLMVFEGSMPQEINKIMGSYREYMMKSLKANFDKRKKPYKA